MAKIRPKPPKKYKPNYDKMYRIIRNNTTILDFSIEYDFSMAAIQNIHENKNVTIYTILRFKEALEDLTGKKLGLSKLITIKEKRKKG